MNRKYTLIRDNWNNVDTTQLEKKTLHISIL